MSLADSLHVVSEDVASLQACLQVCRECGPGGVPDHAFQLVSDCQGWRDWLASKLSPGTGTSTTSPPTTEKIPADL